MCLPLTPNDSNSRSPLSNPYQTPKAEIKAEAAAETKAAEAKEGGLWLRVRVHSSWGGVGEHKRVGLDSLSLVDGEGKQLPLPASSLLVFQGLTQVSSFNF